MTETAMTRRDVIITLGAALGVAGWGLADGASAQSSRPGRLTARAFTRLSGPLTLTVVSADDTPSAPRVRQAIVRALEKAGHRVVTGDAPWRLSFATEVRLAGAGAAPRGGAMSAPGDSALPSEPGDGGPLPDRPLQRRSPADRVAPAPLPRHVINATLDDMSNGRTRWQGHVRYDAAEPDPASLLVRLAPVLLAELGKSVSERGFVLD